MAHVLAVSRSSTFTRGMLKLLPSEGHTVTVARSDDEALAVLRSSLHPLVVLLDTDSSEIAAGYSLADGYSLERLLTAAHEAGTAWERHAYIILTFLSLARSAQIDDLIAALGATLIPYPLNFEALLAAIAQAHTRP